MNLVQAKPIRVLILSNTLSAGGAERFAACLLKGLSRERICPHLALLRHEITYHLPDDTPVYDLDYDRPSDLPEAVWRLRRCIRQILPDLILGASTAANLVVGLTLLTLKHRPAWIAPVDTNLQRSDLRIRKMILKHMQNRAEHTVAISRGMFHHLKTVFPRAVPSIVQLYYPVDFDHIRNLSKQKPLWQRPRQDPLIMTAARAHPVKRLDILLEAFAKVLQNQPAAMALCGDGPQLNALKDQARKLKISGKVHFLGQCPNPFAIMAQADLFVLSSEAEGLSCALIEAQGMGLSAVATRCAFGPEEIVVHGETGLLTPVNDSDAMARAITTLLADERLRNRMGAAAKEKVRGQFDFQERCREWEQLICQAALNRRRSAL